MQIGGIVLVKAKLERAECHDGYKHYLRFEFHKPIRCIYLGYSYLHEGTVRPGDYVNEDTYVPGVMWVNHDIRVAVVQPLSDNQRYRTAIYVEHGDCFPE